MPTPCASASLQANLAVIPPPPPPAHPKPVRHSQVLSKTLEGRETEVSQLQQQVARLTLSVREGEEASDEKDRRIAQLTSQLRELEGKRESLMGSISSRERTMHESLNKANEEARAQLEIITELKAKLAAAEDVIATQVAEIARLKAQVWASVCACTWACAAADACGVCFCLRLYFRPCLCLCQWSCLCLSPCLYLSGDCLTTGTRPSPIQGTHSPSLQGGGLTHRLRAIKHEIATMQYNAIAERFVLGRGLNGFMQ